MYFRPDPERVGPIGHAKFVRPLRGRHFSGECLVPGSVAPATPVNPLRGFSGATCFRTRLVRNAGWRGPRRAASARGGDSKPALQETDPLSDIIYSIKFCQFCYFPPHHRFGDFFPLFGRRMLDFDAYEKTERTESSAPVFPNFIVAVDLGQKSPRGAPEGRKTRRAGPFSVY